MIATASALMQRQGYHGTGLQQIIESSGSPKGSLYHYFPGGKEQLAAEGIARGGRAMSNALKAALDTGDDLADGFERLAQMLAEALEASDFHDGCPIATTTLEVAADLDLVQAAAAEAFQAWHSRIERRLVQEGHTPEEAGAAATLVIAAFEGALIMARALRDVAPLRQAAASLRPLLAAKPR